MQESYNSRSIRIQSVSLIPRESEGLFGAVIEILAIEEDDGTLDRRFGEFRWHRTGTKSEVRSQRAEGGGRKEQDGSSASSDDTAPSIKKMFDRDFVRVRRAPLFVLAGNDLYHHHPASTSREVAARTERGDRPSSSLCCAVSSNRTRLPSASAPARLTPTLGSAQE